jgi:hypothetical protein
MIVCGERVNGGDKGGVTWSMYILCIYEIEKKISYLQRKKLSKYYWIDLEFMEKSKNFHLFS